MASESSGPSWVERARAALGGGLEPAQQQPFLDDLAETNRRRLRVLMPILVVGHAIHIAMFHVSPEEHAALSPIAIRWRQGIELSHALTLLAALPLAWVAWRGPLRWMRWGTPAGALLYLWHGAACASFDQLKLPAASPFIGYAFGIAVAQIHTRRGAAIVYVLGVVAFLAGIAHYQADATARMAIMPTGVSAATVGLALSWLLNFARRRDFKQRATIDQQRNELTRLNSELEQRVHEQVVEIVKRAEEVEALNAQLRDQVRDRSAELSAALARLGETAAVGKRLRPGDVLAERFRIGEVLGEGGMGTVYAGTDLRTGVEVAIKVVLYVGVRDLDTLQRFVREAAAATQIDHPAVVRMLHLDVTDDGTLFQVQERVAGESLQERLRPGKPWDPAVVCRLGALLCEALAAAHRNDVVHRDVKPGNLMLTRDSPGLKLLDFGIAKLQQDDASLHAATTRTGALLGTPAYMSPEQLIGGSRDVTDRADVYAVGVLLYLLLTGHLPSERRTLADLVAAQRGGHARPTPDPRTHVALLPGQLATLVMSCLDQDPLDRPSAESLARELTAHADTHGVPTLDVLESEGKLHDDQAGESFAQTTRRT